MDPRHWIAGFRDLHERERKKSLSEKDKEHYLQLKSELATSLMRSRGHRAPAGEPARKHFLVAQMFPVELDETISGLTREISLSRFTTVVQGALQANQEVRFTIRVSRQADPITGIAKVTAVEKLPDDTVRARLQILSMSQDCSDRLESALFDAVLARFE